MSIAEIDWNAENFLNKVTQLPIVFSFLARPRSRLRSLFISKMSDNCRPILYFPQPNFISLIRQSAESGELNVKGLDKDTVLHLTASHGENHSSVRALYLTVKSQLSPEQRQEAAKELVESLPNATARIVVFVAETEDLDSCLSAFLFPPNTNTPTETIIMSPPTSKLFHSRSILETDILKESSVGIIGLGSGGSQVAVEFAKAGVGKLVLVDYDRLELNNISRHACGLSDIGRLKTNALKDLLLNKNPQATIQTFELDINETTHNDYPAMKDSLRLCDLIIAATDTVQSRYNINTLSLELRITTIYGKCSTRAAGGEVLRVRPGSSACLACVYGTMQVTPDEAVSFERLRKVTPAYVPDSDVEAKIQVGLSSDITPISNMIVKLSLVELCRGKPSGISSLESELTSEFYRWANRREQEFKSYPEGGFDRFDKPAILRWYPVSFQPDPNCMTCSIGNILAVQGSSDDTTAETSDKVFFGTN